MADHKLRERGKLPPEEVNHHSGDPDKDSYGKVVGRERRQPPSNAFGKNLPPLEEYTGPKYNAGRGSQPRLSHPTMAHGHPRVETEEHKAFFEVWYANDCRIENTARKINVSHMALRRYIAWFNWWERAKERDGVERQMAHEKAAEKAAEIVEAHHQAALKLLSAGLDYIEENGIDKSADAIRAILAGIEIQRKNLDMPDHIVQVMRSSDAELIQRAQQLMEAIQLGADIATTAPGPQEEKRVVIINGDNLASDGSDSGAGSDSGRTEQARLHSRSLALQPSENPSTS